MSAGLFGPGSLGVEGVAPPGWESTVKRMKKHRDISNPFALAWYLKKHGARPHKKKAKAAGDVFVEADEELVADAADNEFWERVQTAQVQLRGQIPDVFVQAALGNYAAQSFCLAHTPYRVG